jgi:hypothetical protein
MCQNLLMTMNIFAGCSGRFGFKFLRDKINLGILFILGIFQKL